MKRVENETESPASTSVVDISSITVFSGAVTSHVLRKPIRSALARKLRALDALIPSCIAWRRVEEDLLRVGVRTSSSSGPEKL